MIKRFAPVLPGRFFMVIYGCFMAVLDVFWLSKTAIFGSKQPYFTLSNGQTKSPEALIYKALRAVGTVRFKHTTLSFPFFTPFRL